MSALDIVVIVVIAVSALLAFARGIVRETLAILGWIAGAAAVIYGLVHVRPYARDIISHEMVADIAAGTLIFIVVLVVVAVISSKIAGRVKDTSFGTLDRSLGFLFGLVRGFVLVSLFYLLLLWAYTPEQQPKWIEEARTRPALQIGARFLEDIAPQGFLEAGRNASERVKRSADEADKANDTLKRLPGYRNDGSR